MKRWGAIGLLALAAHAHEAPHGVRSPRGLLMGDAWTAVANDDYTLFYNPAALARHARDFTLFPLNPTVSSTNIISDLDKYEDFPDSPSGVADLMMNEPVHVATNVAPGFKLFNFGFNFIASESADLLLRNRIHPTLDIDYRSDRGFAAGFAVPVGPGRLTRKSKSGSSTNLGLGFKYIKRKGLKDSMALTGTDLLDYIDSDADAKEIVDRLGLMESDAWGFDAGIEHVVREGNNQWVLSLAALDITNTDFEVEDTGDGKSLPSNRGQLNLGTAWMYRSSLFRGTFSLDVRDLTEKREFLERFRLGAELGIPIVSVMGGWNAGYYSYGLGLDLGLLKLIGGFYGVEAGSGYRQTESPRLVIYLGLFDFSFDA